MYLPFLVWSVEGGSIQVLHPVEELRVLHYSFMGYHKNCKFFWGKSCSGSRLVSLKNSLPESPGAVAMAITTVPRTSIGPEFESGWLRGPKLSLPSLRGR